MQIQPLVGATAGLFVLLILESGVVEPVGSDPRRWATVALLSLAAGFSEPLPWSRPEDRGPPDKKADQAAPNGGTDAGEGRSPPAGAQMRGQSE
jgi:hypothetical protein